MFSQRLDFDLRSNRLTELFSQKLRRGVDVIDLTLTNPTRAGFTYPENQIREAFAAASDGEYSPDPLGLPEARSAVSDYYRARGQAVSPDDVVITASTSEAYSFLFRLLADPGDGVMVPEPGYPLFEYLLRLDSLVALPFPVRYSDGWWYDFGRGALDSRARAVIIVSPGNPAGNYIKKDEWRTVTGRCAGRGAALICDEVFHEFSHSSDAPEVDMAVETGALSFVLNGFSKTAGLPQLKMSWILVRGPGELKREALQKLEFISDTFLSTSTAVQRASGEIFRMAPLIRTQIRSRIGRNLAFLKEAAGESAVDCMRTEGGWSAVLRLPGIMTCGEWALLFLDQHDLLSHPGSFYGMEDGPFIVVSLLPEEDFFREGVCRIMEAVAGPEA